jgi:hypothetical protein
VRVLLLWATAAMDIPKVIGGFARWPLVATEKAGAKTGAGSASYPDR